MDRDVQASRRGVDGSAGGVGAQLLLLLGFTAALSTPLGASSTPRDRVRPAAEKAKASTKRQKKPRRNIPVVLARYTFFGEVPVRAAAGGQSHAVTTHFLRMQAQFGHFFRRSGTVVAGALGYDQAQLGFRDDSGAYGYTPLHHLSARLVLGQRLRRRWMLTAFVRPGVASDFQGIDGRDVRVSAGAVVRFAYKPRLSFAFGALYNNGVFGHLVLPVLNIQYRTRLLRVLIRFPHQFQVWLTPHRSAEVGLEARVVSGLFRLHRASVLGDSASLLYVTFGPVVRQIFLGGVFAQLSGGYAARYLQLYRDDQRTHATLDFRGWYLSATLGYLI